MIEILTGAWREERPALVRLVSRSIVAILVRQVQPDPPELLPYIPGLRTAAAGLVAGGGHHGR